MGKLFWMTGMMRTQEYKNVISNINPQGLRRYAGEASFWKHWQTVRDLVIHGKASAMLDSVLFWQINPGIAPEEMSCLKILKDEVLSFFVVPDFPEQNPRQAETLFEGRLILDQKGMEKALRQASLALQPGFWKMPVEVSFEKKMDCLHVSFANGDSVLWPTGSRGKKGMLFEKAYIDHKEDPYAVLIPTLRHGQPAALGWDVIRRDTGTLPAKETYPHKLEQGDLLEKAFRFGRRLFEIAGAKGLTQEELANRARLSREQLNRIMNGRHFPQVSTLKKLAAALKMDIETLLENVNRIR